MRLSADAFDLRLIEGILGAASIVTDLRRLYVGWLAADVITMIRPGWIAGTLDISVDGFTFMHGDF